ncbi:SusC/RagA family TonB-linked outer membrane protein [Alistipes sp.]|uniref:SusC/RagA family TonB-linked outer membrane protein n=1 Tax=Alistipes sp. TaxID=1872444 RepID=UPI003AF0D553
MKKLIIIALLLSGIALPGAATAAGTTETGAAADTLLPAGPAVPGALFTTSRNRTTGALSTAAGETLRRNTAPNLTNSLAGQLEGLTLFQGSGEPGNDLASWLIRGIGSYGNAGYNSAKIFVDGFEVNAGYIAYLSPQEIERVSVLRDGAALALFGERGANGVLWIETKRGRIGPATVSASVRFGLQQATALAEPLDSYGYASLYNQAVSNDQGRWAPAYDEKQLEAYRNGSGTNVNWKDEALRDAGYTIDGDVAFRGGSRVARYNVMLNYLNQQGLYDVKNSDARSNRTYERYNLRANLDFTLFKFIDARVDLGGRIERGKRPNISTDDLFYNMARYPANIYEIWDDAERTRWSGTSVYNSNPVASLNALGWRQTQSRVLQGNFSLTERLDFITPGLYLIEAFSFNTYTKSGYSKTRNYARYHNGVRTTTDEDTSLQASGYGSDGMEDWKQGRITLGYDRTLGRHALTGAVDFHLSAYNGDGYFSYKYRYANLNGRFNYAYDDRYVAEFGFSYFGNDAFAPGNQWAFYPSVSAAWVLSNEAFLRNSKTLNLLKLRLSYGRSGFADSGATGVLSNFSSNGRYLFKDYYTDSYVGSFYMGAGEGVWQSSLVHMFLSNPGLHAEKSSKYNVGIDAELFGNRLRLSADAFLDKRTDILTLDNSMMGYYGKNYSFENIGRMTNRGFEASLVWTDQRARWGYSVNGSVSFNRNKIDYMAEVAPAYDYNAQTGRPYGTLIGLVADGFYDVDDFEADGSLREGLPQPMFGSVQPGDIRYLDLDRSGFVDQNDITKIGKSPYPEWTYSLGAAFNYRGFDVSFLLQGIAGASFNLLDNAVQTRAFVDNGNAYPLARGAWAYYPDQGIDTRATATYPRLTTQSNENNYRLSSFWVRSRNFLRVRHIEVGYNFHYHAGLRAAGISNLRIYLNVTNPFTVSKLLSDYDLDPELLSYRYPALKSYNVGVSLTF